MLKTHFFQKVFINVPVKYTDIFLSPKNGNSFRFNLINQLVRLTTDKKFNFKKSENSRERY